MYMKQTFSLQDSLPKLPVPTLQETKDKLIQWIEPLVTEEQYTESKAVIEGFFAADGAGEKLQKKLIQWDENTETSWLTPLWKEMYLKNRNSLPLTANFNVLLKEQEQFETLAELVGKVSHVITRFYHEIVDETLAPSVMRDRALDMSQFRHFFRSVRIPEEEKDRLFVAPMTKVNNHIVVLHKNNVYKLPVTTSDGIIYDYQQIALAVEDIIFSDTEKRENVGVYTAARREEAAQVYELLRMDEINVDTLDTIAEALVVISLDDESTNKKEAIKNLMLKADNKYFDKTIQVIITQDGQIGFNVEHTLIDGTSIASLVEYVGQGIKELMPWQTERKAIPQIEEKHWVVTNEVKAILKSIQKEYEQKTKDYSLLSKTFLDFGSEQIKALQVSPDAFFHTALQVAQYRTFGEFKSVYEPVSVRTFKEGRTECARATSMEKIHFVEALESGTESKETLYKLLQEASNAHTERIRESQKGLGIERHLYGLEQMFYLYREELGIDQLPALFHDKGFDTLRYDFISTSGMNYHDAQYRMFAPVTQDGHGLAYMIHDYTITINLSSFMHHAMAGNLLKNNLIQALRELEAIAQYEGAFGIA